MTTTVTITRCRHALEGQSLVVIGHFRRHGRLELLVVLGDGSKRLIPAEWTDHDQPETTAREGVCAAVPQTLGTTADLLVVCGLVSALLARRPGTGSRLHGSHRPRRTSMQPAQLSLPLPPDHAPETPPIAMIPLPESGLTAAITVLAGLIAKASMLYATETGPAAMDPAGTQDGGDD